MSSDGRYVVGNSYHQLTGSTARPSQAYIADTQTGSFINLSSDPEANLVSRANAVSRDGSVVVGQSNSTRGTIWKRQADGSYQRSELHLDGSTSALNPTTAVSDNGLWATGQGSTSPLTTDGPYLVNVATGSVTNITKLPNQFGDRALATPSAISNDGQTIIGTHQVGTGTLDTNLGFIWTAAGGVTSLDDYFAGYGIDLTNHYNFVSPLAMSDDAMTFTGIALDNLTGGQVGFVVSLTAAVPEPGSYALLAAGLGALGFVARRRRAGKA